MDTPIGKFYDWLIKNDDPNNIFCPPMNGQVAVNMLMDYLLGEDYYVSDPVCTEQVNTEAVYDILLKYSPKFRKERKKFVKVNRRKSKDV
jgi:hypothetical protein